MNSFSEKISALLDDNAPREAVLENVLRETLTHFRSETGTIHLLDPDKQLLHLAAQVGLPPQLLDVVKTIPVGKGIAGQVAAQNKPVSICNLQTDSSGVAKPGARQTGVGGSLCVPVRQGDKLTGTLGIGTVRPYEYTADETGELEEIGRRIGEFLIK
ncbi:MAG TPA: GAF domain-containing protein [Candidatus Acidoferrales bacterium]|jgi:L-methionine (R)-S-oxide reductase|nr:GAF domain-containing protein [Candidatus Acidoferrales bacterium]